MFRGILVKNDSYGYRASLVEMSDERLSTGNVTVAVEYPTLNYKDCLAITGSGPVLRAFPLIPGVDLAGTVESSDDPRYKSGDRVLVNGCGIGELTPGGLAERVRVHADWIVPMPTGLSTRQAMEIGTAGFTAMLCILALERHGVTPERGEVLVTGATGGVGSIAVAILAKLGFSVVAASGRTEHVDYLRRLGAAEIIGRGELNAPGKPLVAKERWAGLIDTIGSHTLANACAATKRRGVVAACGLVQGIDFHTTVAPFILRAVTLVGVECAVSPTHVERIEAWERLAGDLDPAKLDLMTREFRLSEAIECASELLSGMHKGRVVINVRL